MYGDNGKNRFASQGVSIAQMIYVSKYKSHKKALFNCNSMKKSNIAPISSHQKHGDGDCMANHCELAERVQYLTGQPPALEARVDLATLQVIRIHDGADDQEFARCSAMRG